MANPGLAMAAMVTAQAGAMYGGRVKEYAKAKGQAKVEAADAKGTKAVREKNSDFRSGLWRRDSAKFRD